MEKNDTQISGFAVMKKSSKSLKKNIFRIKNPSSLFLQNDLQKMFRNKWVSKYLTLGDFTVPKTALHHKIIKKTRSKKFQENSVQCFGDNYLSNHLVKILQDRIKA